MSTASTKRKRHPALSKKELRDKVLDLFGSQAYWDKNELSRELGNADGLMKCLDEICIRITKKGLHFGKYELKPELSGRTSNSALKPE